jgi:aldos-2-ulose dehydratase/isomerase family protein/VCBS repeat protein/FG-GAP repeat protein
VKRALWMLALPALAAPPNFVEHTIASDLRGGYQVVVADLNHDGKPDLIALASGMKDLVWFEAPGWQRHVLAAGQNRMINCAVIGDEIVLASEFSNEAKNSIGLVSVLRPGSDVREPWTATEIDRLPTSHRLRIADIFANGKPVVINAPLTAEDASGPEYRGQTPLVYYVPGEWKRKVISTENSGVVHGIFVEQNHCLLTASFTGIHEFCFAKDGTAKRKEIAKGDPAPWPKSGSSDVAVGHLGKARFLAAIEPWHGNQVVVYDDRGRREVIDDSLVDGHTIQTGDFDDDGKDEIIAGFRGGSKSVFLYRFDGKAWTKSELDKGGMGAAACAIADLNGDGRLDVACIDGTRLKWYENR